MPVDQALDERTNLSGKEIMPGLEPRSFRFFADIQSSQNASVWGTGASEIVCAGKLANLIRIRLGLLKEANNPEDAQMQQFKFSTRVWIEELNKLLDAKTARLPKNVLRTVDGARFVRENPEISTAAFVEKARAAVK